MSSTSDKQGYLSVPRARAVLAGSALIVGLAFLMPYINLGLRKYDWAFRPLPTGPLFVLFVLIWPLNTWLRLKRPSWAFTRSELLLMYAMMAICAGLAYEGLWGYALYYSVYPFYGATPANRYAELFLPHLPMWLMVPQVEAVEGFFHGAATWSWRLWLTPILGWSAFALGLYSFLFCLGAVVRRDWIESERLSFPLAAIPLELAGDDRPTISGRIFRNPYLWIGFAFPVLQSLLQMGHALAPSVPYTRLYFPLGQWFTNRGAWESLSGTSAYIGFDTIGIFGLVPLEVSLSLWVFFLLNRAQVLSFAVLGYGREGFGARLFNPNTFIAYEESGACIMLALIVLWRSRGYLARAFGSLVGRSAPSDPLAPVSPRTAALGLICSGVVLFAWATRAGMDITFFAILTAIYLGYSLAMARLVSAGGVYVPDVSIHARGLVVAARGAASIPAPTLTMMTVLKAPFMSLYKLNLLHLTLNDFKIGHSARLPGRLIALCMWAAIVLMMVIVPWVTLHYAYGKGALNFDWWLFRDSGGWEFGPLVDDLRAPRPAASFLWAGLGAGAGIMLLLTWLHARFIWFAISPIGFLLGGTWGMTQRMWASAFIAWLLVFVIRRFGGLRLYRTVRPAFLGMVTGHLVMMGLRSLIGPIFGINMHLAAWE
jgi:hypothetical protein